MRGPCALAASSPSWRQSIPTDSIDELNPASLPSLVEARPRAREGEAVNPFQQAVVFGLLGYIAYMVTMIRVKMR